MSDCKHDKIKCHMCHRYLDPKLQTYKERNEKACDALETLRDAKRTSVKMARKIDEILWDLEGGEDSFDIELVGVEIE